MAFPLVALAGEPVPVLDAKDTRGQPVSLEALRGHVVVLDFWASWCGPCRKSFPFLDALAEQHRAQGLEVIGLTLEDDDDAVQTFLASLPVRFTIARDPSGAAGDAFKVVVMPTTFLIDREGKIAARFEGGAESVHAKLAAAVDALLNNRPLPAGTDVRAPRSVESAGAIKAWERGYLADPIMNLDGDPLTRLLREHIFASKEAASGDGGAAGGGCGCN